MHVHVTCTKYTYYSPQSCSLINYEYLTNHVSSVHRILTVPVSYSKHPIFCTVIQNLTIDIQNYFVHIHRRSIGEWWKLHYEELHDLYFSPTIVWVIKSRMRRVGHVARMGERRGMYRVSVGKPEGNRPLGRPRCRWRIILRWVFRKWDVGVRTGLSWLRIETGGRHLWRR
jgi:hypothetical protein